MSRPGLTKPKCLTLLADNFLGRKWRVTRAGEYVAGKLFTKGFWLQAGQALYSVTNGRYGLILGGLEALKTDAYWTAVRGLHGGNVQVNLPSEKSVLEKATQHLLIPPYHHGMSSTLSIDEHLALLAADVWAIRTLRAEPASGDWSSRVDEFLATPVPSFEPTNQLTIDALRAEGWTPGSPQRPPFPELPDVPTYGEAYAAIMARHDQALRDLAGEYPEDPLGRFYVMLMQQEGEDVFTALNGGMPAIEPVYSDEEYVIARMFEYSIFPPGDPSMAEVGLYIERALSLSRAVGKKLPGPSEVRAAVVEVWGVTATA